MKRWVIKTSEGLTIVSTAGNEPHCMVCEAQDDWESDNLVLVNGVVVHVEKNRYEKKPETKEFALNVYRTGAWIERHGFKIIGAVLLIASIFVLSKFL